MSVTTNFVSVVLSETKEVMRLGQQQMVASAGSFEVVGVAQDASALLDLVREAQPKIVVLNDQLPGANELGSLVDGIREISPDTSVVVTLTSANSFWLALEARAQAYCEREGTAENFRETLRAVASGQCALSPSVTEYLLRGDGYRQLQKIVSRYSHNGGSALDTLSPREREVIDLLAQGHSNERIAQILGLSIQTVKVHVKHILKKLKVSDRTQAVIKALKAQ